MKKRHLPSAPEDRHPWKEAAQQAYQKPNRAVATGKMIRIRETSKAMPEHTSAHSARSEDDLWERLYSRLPHDCRRKFFQVADLLDRKAFLLACVLREERLALYERNAE